MKIKNGLICLLVVTASSLCVVNVTAALPHNPAPAYHSKIVTDMKTTIPTTLTFTCPTQAKVNESFNYRGSLTAGGQGVSGATINVQWLRQGQWKTFASYHTHSDGSTSRWISFPATGTYNIRLSYDGDSQYASSVSKAVIITVR